MSENVLVTMMGGRITHQEPGFVLAEPAENQQRETEVREARA